MNYFKLKLVLALLTGFLFSFILILLAFVLPSKEEVYTEPKGLLEKISHAAKNK